MVDEDKTPKEKPDDAAAEKLKYETKSARLASEKAQREDREGITNA